jgi:tetratricopeptide (TPR) repeat protein
MPKEFLNIVKVCDQILKYSIYALVALLPILFLPWTSDVLDFNKQTAVVFIIFIGLFSWMIKVLVSGGFRANLNKTHIAVLVLFLVLLASTVFSQAKYLSFWGSQKMISDALLSVISLIILYFLISNSFSKAEIFLSVVIFALSGILTAAFGMFQLFGLFTLPFSFAKIASFNTIGSVGSFGFFIAILLPILIILEICASKPWLKIILGAGIAISAVSLVLINYPVVWWMILVSSALVVLFGALRRDIFDLRWLGLAIFFLILALFFLILKPQISVPSRPIEVYLNQQATFDVALKTLKNNPILGSGPGTFAFDFAKYKKIDFNQGQLWNVRFDAGSSKILTLLATTGILGLFAFLALMAVIIFYIINFIFSGMDSKESRADDNYFWLLTGGIAVAFVSEAIGYFLYTTSFSLDFIFFFLIACFVGLISKKKEYQLSPSSFLTLGVTFIFTLFFIFGLGLLILQGQRYLAEVNYFKGAVVFASGQKNEGLAMLESAVSQNPNSDVYFINLSQAYLSKLADEVNRKDIPETDKSANIQILFNNAINAAKITTDLNPNDAGNWSARGFVYQNLISLGIEGMDEWAIKSYDQAIVLEPNNPYYPVQKGIVYMAKASTLNKTATSEKAGLLSKAEEQFNKAIQLKSDYSSARFQLASLYQEQGKTDQVIPTLKEAQKYAPNDVGLIFQIGLLYYQGKDYEKAKIELEKILYLNPNYANGLYFLGLSYAKLGQKSSAIDIINKVLVLNPDNAEIKKVLDNIKNDKNPLDGIEQQNPPQEPVKEIPEKTKK